MENMMLPQELTAYIGSENKDFAVKANRSQPLKKSFSAILSAIAYFGFLGILAMKLQFSSADMLMSAIFLGVLGLLGLALLVRGIYFIFKKGGYFIGTPNRLVHFQNGKIRSIDWEQFSGDIEASGNFQKGSISLTMRTGKLVKRKNIPDTYVPHVIDMTEIPNVFEVEKICRKRIKENDPNPTTNENQIKEI